jgi:beta-hydroxylase
MNSINKRHITPDIEYMSTNTKYFTNLRNNWTIIRDEYVNYCNYNKKNIFRAKNINPSEIVIDYTDIPWEILILKCYNKNTNLIKYFPATYELLGNTCTTAMFSILPPGKSLPLHYGSYNGVLRYHLALIVPKDFNNCYIEVNNIKKHWQEGQDIYFDDTIYHMVANNTNESRVVLVLDIPSKFTNTLVNYFNKLMVSISKFNINVDTIVNNTNSLVTDDNGGM